ncbi:MAG: glycosyltransferase [Candidatus Bathyarchaeia archaeon]
MNNPPRENLIVTISRFGPGKGLEKIPYIASLIDKNIKFAIIGRTHYKDTLLSLQKLVKKLNLTDRIKFLPDLSITEMKNTLRKAKIYLHTMVGEHFGISIVQAMAMGCIPIVHNSGGAKEFIPSRYRYNNIHEAATKIINEIYEWSPSKAQNVIKIAERFREVNFSEKFMKLFEKYIKNNFM